MILGPNGTNPLSFNNRINLDIYIYICSYCFFVMSNCIASSSVLTLLIGHGNLGSIAVLEE